MSIFKYTKSSKLSALLTVSFLIAVFTLSSHAQATRTWVSGVGDDVNPCSRTAPCKTFAGAISKTADGGEIDAIDPGGYGALTITKSLTIDGAGTSASILASAVQGIIINAAADDVIILRNLSINGAGTTLGTNGISFLAAGKLIIENCRIFNFSTAGLNINSAFTASISIHNTTFYRVGTGVTLSSISNNIKLAMDDTHLETNTNGLNVASGAIIAIRGGVIGDNTTAGIITTGAGQVNLEGILISGNGTGINAGGTSTVRMSNLHIYNNTTGITRTGVTSTLASFSNNKFAGNGTQGAPTSYLASQ